MAEGARGVAAEATGDDGQRAARRGRKRDEQSQRRRDRRIAELVRPILRERAPGRKREREAEERVRQGDQMGLRNLRIISPNPTYCTSRTSHPKLPSLATRPSLVKWVTCSLAYPPGIRRS